MLSSEECLVYVWEEHIFCCFWTEDTVNILDQFGMKHSPSSRFDVVVCLFCSVLFKILHAVMCVVCVFYVYVYNICLIPCIWSHSVWVQKLNSGSPNELPMLFIADLSLQPSKSFFFLNWFFCLKLSNLEWGVWSFQILLYCYYVSLWSLMLCVFHLSKLLIIINL